MPGNRFDGSCRWVAPQRVCFAFPFKVATMPPQVAEEVARLHFTVTFSRTASLGIPRNPSSRRSSRIREMASDRLCNASSFDFPCPFAPGTSGEYAMNQSSSRSTTAVNSALMARSNRYSVVWPDGSSLSNARLRRRHGNGAVEAEGLLMLVSPLLESIVPSAATHRYPVLWFSSRV